MDNNDFLNSRALKLESRDSVLFLFNLASGNNFSNNDVEVTSLSSAGSDGETMVHVKGREYKGLSGIGEVKGTAGFTYFRRNLGALSLPLNGSFFEVFSETPSFLAVVAEFKRRTSFNCTPADFDESAFAPDATGDRWLKASPTSWRFVGEVNLGRPQRDDISIAMAGNIRASLSSYDGVFWNNLRRLKADMVISHRPDDYARLSVGFLIDRPNDPMVPFLLQNLGLKGVDVEFAVWEVESLNIFRTEVVYRGPLRPGDVPPIANIDRVIALKLPIKPSLWGTGELKLWYSTTAHRAVSTAMSTLSPINLASAKLVDVEYVEMLNNAQVGDLYRDVGDSRDISDLFLSVTGLAYRPEVWDTLMVSYNGPNRPIDQVPIGQLSCRVIEFNQSTPPTAGFSGPLKFYYKVN